MFLITLTRPAFPRFAIDYVGVRSWVHDPAVRNAFSFRCHQKFAYGSDFVIRERRLVDELIRIFFKVHKVSW